MSATRVRPVAVRRRRSGTLGFTIVELMVVIAIIVLLLAILLPSMSAARDASRVAVCASNQRQLSNVTYAYAAESFGCIPYRLEPKPGDTRPPGYTWADWDSLLIRGEHIEAQDKFDISGQVWACPLFGQLGEPARRDDGDNSLLGRNHYGMNFYGRIEWENGQWWEGDEAVAGPYTLPRYDAHKILFADAWVNMRRNRWPGPNPESPVSHSALPGTNWGRREPGFEPWPASPDLNPAVNPIVGEIWGHGGVVNVSGIDGHVEQIAGFWDSDAMESRFRMR